MTHKLVEFMHKMDDGRLHQITFDLSVIKIHCLTENPIAKACQLHWHIPGVEEENTTILNEPYEKVKKMIWGDKSND